MATKQSTVDFIIEQAAPAGNISARKMFGEYGLYCDGKLAALICDDRLFIKPTPSVRSYVGETTELPPYPGAKPQFCIDADRWDDPEWLAGLIRLAASTATPAKAKRR